MLEIINLKKTYKTKQGVKTHALNGVSLKFPETGLVFLLGKSGSGKSTLLNICGGLDSPTEGEIIIKERSSKAFSQTDFDSYRNTFVGFIFQEYNILYEFSVEDNIALALELQGKPKDINAINSLLAEVDLEGLGKRKPNTLSGGQKQRIAIARALIKSPEIIMADEPTGALDSTTGKQVFDTLKKLSKDKLIIVVSHDRDFAEQYGDRIIELKDGKVISDVTKTEEHQEKINNNISVIGEEILCVKDGEELTEEDFSLIKNFLKNNKNSIICNNQKDVTSIKKAARITDDGSKEVFIDTDHNSIPIKNYTKEDSKFIKSKLPLKHAIKIGVSSLKVKPFKLFLTICLCSFAFVLFGLLSTMMLYNNKEVFKSTLSNSNYETFKLGKFYKTKETSYFPGSDEPYNYTNHYSTKLTEEEFKKFKDEYGSKTIGAVKYYTDISNVSQKEESTSYYKTNIQSIAYLEEDNPLRNNITGTYPEKNDQIVISSYLAESILHTGLTDPTNNKKYTLSSTNDLIDKKIKLSEKIYTISGIIEVTPLSSDLDILKNTGEKDTKLINKLNTEIHEGLYLVIYGTKEELKNIPISDEELWSIFQNSGELVLSTKSEYKPRFQYTEYKNAINLFDISYFDENNKTIEENEIIINFNGIMNIIDERINNLPEYQRNKYYGYTETDGINYKLNKLSNENLTTEVINSYVKDIVSFLKETKLDEITLNGYNTYDGKEIPEFSKKVKIIRAYKENRYNGLFVSKELKNEIDTAIKKNYISLGYDFYISETDYEIPQNSLYDILFLEFNKNNKNDKILNSLYKYSSLNENELSSYKITSILVEEITTINEVVKALSKVFLYAGLVIAVFAILLLSNFISNSISNKTKEIGILRAVGARSIDVFKIFFSETFVISLICILLSAIGGNLVCSVLNNNLASITNITIFVFGIPSILILIIVSIITTLVATLFPVYKAAHKKPVDSIRGA